MKAAALPFPSPRRLPAIDPWRALPWLFAGMVLAPAAVVASAFFTPAGDVWRHLAQTTLTETLLNTLWLALGVGTGATLIGTGLAWLTACCEFPGRRFFSWALLLPLAVPAYVTAFVAVACWTTPDRCRPRCAAGWGERWGGFPPSAAGVEPSR